MKNKIIALTAPSCAGKDTLLNMFIEKFSNVNPCISYTTRPRRDGELDCVEYYFTNNKVFDYIKHNLVATRKYETEFGIWKYGLAKWEIERRLQAGHAIVIVDLNGLEQLKDCYGDDVVSIYLYLDKDTRTERYIMRDKITFENVKECIRRIEDDDKVFANAQKYTNMSFYNRNTEETFKVVCMGLERYDIELIER